MENQKDHESVDAELFRHFVRRCAQDTGLIAAFNQQKGTQLRIPIAELINYPQPAELSGLEAFDIAVFVTYIRVQLWPRVLEGLTWLAADMQSLPQEDAGCTALVKPAIRLNS